MNTKKRLFEVMGKLDPTFKPSLNEMFGWSEKEMGNKQKQEKIKQAKQEIMKSSLGALAFAQPASEGKYSEENSKKELMLVRLNLLRHAIPSVIQLIPELFDENQGFSSALFLMDNTKIEGLVLNNWRFVVGRDDGLIKKDNGKNYLIQLLDNLN